MTEVSEEQIAALREQIRGAGRATRRGRRTALAVLLALVGLGCARFAHAVPHSSGCDQQVLEFLGRVIGVSLLVGGIATSVPLALFGAGLYRAARSDELQRQLASLPPEAASALLLPLRDERVGDTRKLAKSLLRELRVPAEIAPASAPAGRGDEPTP